MSEGAENRVLENDQLTICRSPPLNDPMQSITRQVNTNVLRPASSTMLRSVYSVSSLNDANLKLLASVAVPTASEITDQCQDCGAHDGSQ